MSGLRPQSLAALLGRALTEYEVKGAIFDLPKRSFWRGRSDFDLSVDLHGERAATPVGPAAGPHTQMAQNLVLGWLAGARAFELKTVQRNDRLEIPRPCIDAATIGFNVEWSQELTLEQSAEQYAIGWLLIHALAARGVTGAPAGQQDFVFHASVGYDLAGIRSEPVARFLDQLHDAAPLLGRLRDGLPPALRPFADVPVAGRIVSCVTLSTFHGCPPAEIERIVEHLFDRHGVHVVVKVNPTLLGFETVDELLRGRLGYRDLVLDREAFAHDLRWEQALGLFGRLSGAAARRGLTLGAKLTNTLTVLNSGQRFRDPVMYLSGQPLHVLAMTLADRFARETAGRIPLAFSAGIDAENFPEAVSCGLAPVTTCTDLLHPTGYRRLPRYLRRLEEEMAALDARSIPEFIVARAGPQGTIANGSRARVPVASEASVRAAALVSLSARAASLPSETRYHAAQNSTAPLKTGRALSLFDCDSCNACLVACPNDAFFSLALGPMTHDAPDVTFAGRRAERPVRFELKSERQWAVFADFCNECGNCDTFCPDTGEPQVAKPRFFGSRESFEADAPRDGILIEARGARAFARFGGVLHRLSREGEHVHFSDGVIEATLDRDGHLLATRSLAPHKGHVLPLWRYHALRVLVDAVVDGINPVTAGWMAEAVGHAESPA